MSIRFWWPWFSEECDECGHRTRRWRGLWYKPAHLDSALASYFISGMPVFERTSRDIRDYEGIMARAFDRSLVDALGVVGKSTSDASATTVTNVMEYKALEATSLLDEGA